ARDRTARDRQRVPARPRARALGRRRPDQGGRLRGQAARRARPAAEPVPDRRPAERAGAPPCQAPLRARRPVLRKPLRAQGRPALLDERQRRGQGPARDILLVSDYDPARGAMILSVPPTVVPRRVSVDAIEHWMIYRNHPDVGAILHVHAWVDGIAATEINYPCGTEELARSVSDLID